MTLQHLGQTSALPASPEAAVLDYPPNPRPGSSYLVRFSAPEFTSLCPVTAQPDFAHLVIDYVPGAVIVESKSLKLFLGSFRNIALGNYMKSFGNMSGRVEDALKLYFHQCALSLSCRQLAKAGRYLMLDGRHPDGGDAVISPLFARRINALMLLCGHYDGSGEFAFRVGIPGKSGVGGGILAIVPGKASIAVWSPGLNARGNSKLGTRALERLAEATGWSVFMPTV